MTGNEINKAETGDEKPSDYDKIRVSALWDSLKRFDGYIVTVNFKSGLLATFNSAVFAGVVLKASEVLASASYPVSVVLFCNLLAISVFALLSMVWVVRSIWPNLSSKSIGGGERSILFFASVAKNFTVEEYIDKVRGISFESFEADLCRQVHEVAVVTSDKMRRISLASKLASINLLLLGFLVLVLLLNALGFSICHG